MYRGNLWSSVFASIGKRGKILISVICTRASIFHSGPENLKKSRPKNLVKSNNSIPFFAISKNGEKSIFELGKYFKLPKMQFHERKC